MEKILIPSDFSNQSLQLIEYAVLNHPNKVLDIVLVHGYSMPVNYWDQINFSQKAVIQNLTDEGFMEQLDILLLEHDSEINTIKIELFLGTNNLAFKRFVEQHKIVSAIIPTERLGNFNRKGSFDPTSYIVKCIDNTLEVCLSENEFDISNLQFSISDLF
ncbi:hypothetical protein [Membranihabitans marinus]|uniref:hypothetical protein n=1 Tax=Membranihabitans marinus TaxID=1227546 RepID=UPI001F278204|nr:hypothetical protein [Membranihabitans marinus]